MFVFLGFQILGVGATNLFAEEKFVKGKSADIPKSINGGYELADVLIWAMPKQVKGENSLPSLQDYNHFKSVVSNIKPTENGYSGTVLILADRKRTVPENITDNYDWAVSIEGPRAGASSISIDSGFIGDKPDIGPQYLRKNNINVIALSCFSNGDTPAQSSSLYLVQYPGKTPILLSYDVSGGSSGRTIKYQLHYGGIEWKNVPGANEVNYKNETQNFAMCPYPSLK